MKDLKDFIEEHIQCTISSGTDTLAHGRSELCLTTETSQGIHFYEQGNCKLGSRNSIELRTGDKATGKDKRYYQCRKWTYRHRST